MAATTVLAPLEANMSLPAPPASPPCDPVLDSLACLFPDIDRDVLAALLAYQGGDVERAAAALLEDSASADNDVAAAADVDAAIAMQMALDIDQQRAPSTRKGKVRIGEEAPAAALGPRAGARGGCAARRRRGGPTR